MEGNLTVYFAGVCTHLWEYTSRVTEHRVVLVNASNGDLMINGHPIHAHTASLRYPGPVRPETLPLTGARITVANASNPDSVTYDDSFFTCIPRMTNFAPKLPPLSRGVVRDSSPDLAAAYFDACGTFSAGIADDQASVAILNVTTTDDQPRLRIEPFDGSSPYEITLPTNAKIQIENLGPGSPEDHNHDFLINFMVAQGIPSDATWPETPASCGRITLPYPHNTVGPGCSNSNYP